MVKKSVKNSFLCSTLSIPSLLISVHNFFKSLFICSARNLFLTALSSLLLTYNFSYNFSASFDPVTKSSLWVFFTSNEKPAPNTIVGNFFDSVYSNNSKSCSNINYLLNIIKVKFILNLWLVWKNKSIYYNYEHNIKYFGINMYE